MTHPTRQRERLVKRFKEVGDGEDWARGDQKCRKNVAVGGVVLTGTIPVTSSNFFIF